MTAHNSTGRPQDGEPGSPLPAPRRRLPDRRITLTIAVAWADRSWLLSVGFYGDGHAGEVFLDGVKTGTQLEGLVDDACVLMSLLLQSGWRPAPLADALGGDAVVPASLYGLALRQIAAIENEARDGILSAIDAVEQRVQRDAL